MKTYYCVYFGSALLAILCVPIVTRVARALRIVDAPGVRKVHQSPVPRIGGVPIVLATLALLIPVLVLDNTIGRAFREVHAELVVLLAAGVFMFLVGLVDDIRGLRARTKLVAQIAAAVAVCAVGVRIKVFSVGDWFEVDFGWLAWPLTIAWIVGITNAVNLIDGLDGLAAGIATVTCGVIATFAVYNGQVVMTALMLALLGSLTGFLFFNFNPAKVFMGDSGTMFVGFLLAGSSVLCAAKSSALVGLAMPALALGLPIFDTVFSVLRRVIERRSIFAPDRRHIHHRLLQMGLNQRHAVMLMYVVTLLVAGLGMFMMVTRDVRAIFVFGFAALMLLAVFRAVGAVRLRDSIKALQRNIALSRQAHGEKRQFENAQLRMRETGSFDDWWKEVCATAKQMDFEWLALSRKSGADGSYEPVWRWRDQSSSPRGLVTMRIPLGPDVRGRWTQVEVGVRINGSLESAGHRATLFGRLLEEHVTKKAAAGDGPFAEVMETPLFGLLRPAGARPPDGLFEGVAAAPDAKPYPT